MKAHVLLVAVTFVWGATFVLIKDALADISPLLFNAVRMTLAAVALVLFFPKAMAKLTRGAALAGGLVGVFLWLGYEFQTTGLTLTTPSKSAFLTGSSVAMVPVMLAIGWRRRVNRWTALGVVIVVAGLYLLTVPASGGAGIDLSSINRGDLLTIGCAVAFALQIITMGRATTRFPFQQVAAMEAIVCAGLMFATVPIVETTRVTWSATVIWAILITGLAGTAVAFTVQAWAQQFTPPTHTALIFSLEPVFAWMTSYVVEHERLGARAAAGALMILTGVLMSELLGSSAPPHEQPAETAEMAD